MFALRQDDRGNAKFVANGGGSEDVGEMGVIFDESTDVPVEAGFFRGTTDTDRTGIFLTRSDRTRVYLYVDTGTTLTVTATHP